MLHPVENNVDFPAQEIATGKFWKEHSVYEKSLQRRLDGGGLRAHGGAARLGGVVGEHRLRSGRAERRWSDGSYVVGPSTSMAFVAFQAKQSNPFSGRPGEAVRCSGPGACLAAEEIG